MFNTLLKNLSILKKFLFINLIIFIIIGSFTIIYLSSVKPNLIKKKTSNHIQIINNTIDHIQRLKIKFNEEDIRKFLFSTRFLFQNLDRVILFDNKYKLVGDTDTLDLDPRSFSQKLNIVEHEILEEKSKKIVKKKNINKNKTTSQLVKQNIEENNLKLKKDQSSIKIMDFNKVKRREKINSNQRVKKIKVVYFD